MFRKMPLILLAVMGGAMLFNDLLSLQMKSIFLAVSLSIKSVIIFVLPFIIFMLLFNAISKLALSSTKIIVFLFIGICCSNFFSTMISYVVGSAVYQGDFALAKPLEAASLEPFWEWNLPKLISNDWAMFLGVLSGLFLPSSRVSAYFERWVKWLLKGIGVVIPVFIAGFAVKLIHDKMMESIIVDYAVIFALIAATQGLYIAFIYLASNRFDLRRCLASIQNMLPAAITGFGSMSSAAAMPLSIMGSEKNVRPEVARLVIPSTVNIHLIGDCLAIPIFAFAILKNFGMAEPTFAGYAVFAFYFVMAKFSVAAVPGGGILVMLPILESHLGFNGEMISLITALYILFDPVITSANVLGNGGFCLLVNNIYSKFDIKIYT